MFFIAPIKRFINRVHNNSAELRGIQYRLIELEQRMVPLALLVPIEARLAALEARLGSTTTPCDRVTKTGDEVQAH
jgi:hypothetical protein